MASDFDKAFASARKEKGAGSTFTYKGKSYSTNRADDTKTGRSSASDTKWTPPAEIRDKVSSSDSDTPTPPRRPVDAGWTPPEEIRPKKSPDYSDAPMPEPRPKGLGGDDTKWANPADMKYKRGGKVAKCARGGKVEAYGVRGSKRDYGKKK